MNKKYMIMFGSLIGFILVVLLTVTILSACNRKSSDQSLEGKLVKAAQKYAKKEEIKSGTSVIVDADKLANEGYIKKLSELNDNNCSGYVKIMNNGGVMNYLPYVECDKYKTTTLKQKIVDDQLTTEGDGLYYSNGEYIFKGKDPKNYVKLGGKLWAVIKIDDEGDLKLLAVDRDDQQVYFDNKYNEDTMSRTGENDYKTSYVRDYIISVYKKYKEENRKHMIPKGICIGKHAKTELDKTSALDCSEILEGEYISLINASDYALASLDKDCNNIISGSCSNFNYFSKILGETWTVNAIKDNSYQAIVFVDRMRAEDTGEWSNVQIVVHVSGNEIYAKGNGTKESPYEFKNIK